MACAVQCLNSSGDEIFRISMPRDSEVAELSACSRVDGSKRSSAAGELVFHVFGAIAHFERRLIVERTRDGIAAARARGKKLGRPTLDDDKLASALKLIDAGVRPAQAAKQLGLGRSTLYRELAALNTGAPATPALAEITETAAPLSSTLISS